MFSVIERKPPIDSQDESGMTLPAVKGDIQLSNVHFSYPARPDVQIFK
jgi:ATP-binding cassette subfamily B (MDR/TAP) protein 1